MTGEQLYEQWQGMSNGQQNDAMAEIMGWHLEKRGKWARDAWCNSEGQMRREMRAWKPSDNRDDAAEVVAEIEQQGLWERWMRTLCCLVDAKAPAGYVNLQPTEKDHYERITASADTRCAAAYMVAKMQEQENKP